MTNSDVSPQEAARELLRREAAQTHLTEFVQYTTPRWEPGRIHREIGEALDAVTRREIDRLILECPPQHGKSSMASKRYPAFVLGKNPTLDVVSVSASAPLAEEFGGEVRNCIRSQEYRALFPDVQLREDTTAKGRWATDDGGGYYAIGIGGQLFGKGGELGIIDDPFSSWEDAQSPVSRKRVKDWYDGTFYNRIRPGGAIVVIQHRTGDDDLVAMLRENEKNGGDRWKVVSIPADLDNPPWIERYDRAALERLKANMAPRKWASLYMQDPTPDDGVLFKREWFRHYNKVPEYMNVYMSGDFAVTPDGGDFTEIAVWGVDTLGDVYALDWWTGQKNSLDWCEVILDRVRRWKPLRFVGEQGPIRRAVEPFLDRMMREQRTYVATEWLPTAGGNKAARAMPFHGMCSSGRVFWPEKDWAERAIAQCLRFTGLGDKHDDVVDTCALMGQWLDKMWASVRPEQQKPVDFNAPMRAMDFFTPHKAASW